MWSDGHFASALQVKNDELSAENAQKCLEFVKALAEQVPKLSTVRFPELNNIALRKQWEKVHPSAFNAASFL